MRIPTRNFVLAVALLVPAALPAFQDRDHATTSQRYYDAKNKDYHDWNDNENQAYHRYVQENHMKDRDFAKLSKRQQQSYFAWRHQHMDDRH